MRRKRPFRFHPTRLSLIRYHPLKYGVRRTKIYVHESIIESILLRMSIKGVVKCKAVCKVWYDLISNPDFAETKLGNERSGILIRPDDPGKISCTLNFVDASIIQRGLLDTNLKIPFLRDEMSKSSNSSEEVDKYGERFRMFGVRPCKELLEFHVVNTCNGLLCLSGTFRLSPQCRSPRLVCNPVTCELIRLPVSPRLSHCIYYFCGFGFCPKTKKYKVFKSYKLDETRTRKTEVLKFFKSYKLDEIRTPKTEILTIGDDTWRYISSPSISYSRVMCPVYMDGALYYIADTDTPNFVMSFDFDTESFATLSQPRIHETSLRHLNTHMLGIIRGRLTLCELYKRSIHIWTMDGDEKNWSNSIKVDISGLRRSYYEYFLPVGSLKCDQYFLFYNVSFVIYYDEKRGEWKKRKICWNRGRGLLWGKPYTPSLISLRNLAPGAIISQISVDGLPPECQSQEENTPYLMTEMTLI